MTKSGHKMTEIEGIPIDWDHGFLEDYCIKITDRDHRTPNYTDEGYPLVAPENFIGTNEIDFQNSRRISQEELELDRKKCDPVEGDILFSRIGTIGLVRLVSTTTPFSALHSISLIRANLNRIDNSFLYHYLKGEAVQQQAKIAIQSGGTPDVGLGKIKKFVIAVPTMPEQQKIAEILTTADKKIELIDKEIQATEKLKKGLMQTLLTKGIGHTKFKMTEIGEIPEEWEMKRIRDLYDVITGTTPSTKVSSYWDSGTIDWITPRDLKTLEPGLFILPSERKITEKGLNCASLELLPPRSILLSTRAPVGYVGLISNESTFNQGCKGLKPKLLEQVNTIYHAYYLSAKTDFLNNLSGGSTFKELSKDALEGVSIPLPPLPEQERMAEILITIDKKLRLLGIKKQECGHIKEGIMKVLLTGQIRVKLNTKQGSD